MARVCGHGATFVGSDETWVGCKLSVMRRILRRSLRIGSVATFQWQIQEQSDA